MRFFFIRNASALLAALCLYAGCLRPRKPRLHFEITPGKDAAVPDMRLTDSIVKERLKLAGITKFSTSLAAGYRLQLRVTAKMRPEYLERILQTTGNLDFAELCKKDMANSMLDAGLTKPVTDSIWERVVEDGAENPEIFCIKVAVEDTGFIMPRLRRMPQPPHTRALQFFYGNPKDGPKAQPGRFILIYAAWLDYPDARFKPRYLASTAYNLDHLDKPIVNLSFSPAGGQWFADITAKISAPGVGFLGICLDGYVLTAPSVTQKIEGGGAMISGGFADIQEARNLSTVLNVRPYPHSVRVRLTGRQ
jgi:hypothetical protein